MTKEEFTDAFNTLITSETIDLTKADELKANIETLYDDLATSQKDNSFYTSQIDDLKRQNRALYLKTNPKTEIETPADTNKQDTRTPYEKFKEGFNLEGFTI